MVGCNLGSLGLRSLRLEGGELSRLNARGFCFGGSGLGDGE